MKIEFFNTNTYSKKQNDVKIKNNNRKNNLNLNKQSVSYPVNYYFTNFKGIPIQKLYEEYNWYINYDRIPAVNSFLKIDAPKEVLNQFLTEILNTKDRSYEYIESIVNQPRNTKTITEQLKQKLGENSQHLLTFIPNSPYNNAYTNYLETKLQNVNTLTELLRTRPDWRGSVLIEKYKQLTGNDNLKIGNIPKQIPKDHLYKIIAYLRNYMEQGFKTNQSIGNLVIDGKTYEFKYFIEGKSSKSIFGFFVPSAAKKYVIKMENPEKRSLDDPFAIGTVAKIDEYLTANRSRNSAPLCFYDYEDNFSIYKYITHTHVDDNPNDINTIRRKLPDFHALGLEYNDNVGFKNFFKLNNESLDTHNKMDGFQEALSKFEWISVDNDHVTYNNKFQPIIAKYNAPLPNAMGMFF